MPDYNTMIKGIEMFGIIDFYNNSLLTPVTPQYFYDRHRPTDLGFQTMINIAKPVIDTLL